MNIQFDLSKLLLRAMFITMLIAALIGMVSCSKYTEQVAETQSKKALVYHPKVIAKIARDAFPCIEKKVDTVITQKDSLIYIDCPDITNGTATDYAGVDTIYKTVTKVTPGKTIKVPVYLPVKTITIEKKIEDSAKIKQLNDGLMASVNETAKANEKVEALQNKIEKKNKWLWIFFIAFLVSAAVNYLQFRSKK